MTATPEDTLLSYMLLGMALEEDTNTRKFDYIDDDGEIITKEVPTDTIIEIHIPNLGNYGKISRRVLERALKMAVTAWKDSVATWEACQHANKET